MEILNSNEILNYNNGNNNNISDIESFIFPDSNIFLYDIDIKKEINTSINISQRNNKKRSNSTIIIKREDSLLSTTTINSSSINEDIIEIPLPPPPPPIATVLNNTSNNNNNSSSDSSWIPNSLKNKYSNGMTQLFRDTPFECSICWDECIETYSFPFCEHTYCRDCVKSHLTEHIWLHKSNSTLSCPYPKCKNTITLLDLESLVDRNVYEKFILYSKIKEKQHIDKDSKIIFCINCDNPMSVSPLDKEIKCDAPGCNCEICIECYTFLHPGIECTQNKQNILNCMSEDEKKTIELFKNEQYKECPKCNRFICKDEGCEWVKCDFCGHEFCYYCLLPHDHVLSTHVHGPLYQAPRESFPLYPPYYHNQRNIHKRRFKSFLKYFGLTFLVIIGLGPAVALGGVVAVMSPLYLLYLGVKHHQRSKKLRKSKSFKLWCAQEIKRREDLGLEVSDYIKNATF